MKLLVLRGDGIGPEIVSAALTVSEALNRKFNLGLEYEDADFGLASIEKNGDAVPQAPLDRARASDGIICGPHDSVAYPPPHDQVVTPAGRLRKAFDLYANIRPARTIMPDGRYDNVDIILIRENTEGLYVGVEHFVPVAGDPQAVAESIAIITRPGCRRIGKFAFDYAVKLGRKKVTVVHKANILKAVSGLFLETVMQVGDAYHDRLEIEDQIVDACAMNLVLNPEQFDVIVTTNMFGDILSDLIAGLVGGLGLAPAANLGAGAAIFEAVHGSAPDIAGQGVANPSSLILSAAMMLDHVGQHERGDQIRRAVETTLRDRKICTRDLGGDASTAGFATAVADELR